MAVHSNLRLVLALLLGSTGCSGSVFEGVPLEVEGGTTTLPEGGSPPAAPPKRDAAAPAVGERDAGAPPVVQQPPAGSDPLPTATRDAGRPPPASAPDAGGGAVTEPPPANGRDYSSDKSKFLGPARCGDAEASVLLCDDFEGEEENAPPDPALWTPVISAATGNAQVGVTRAARGTKSLWLRAESGQLSVVENTKLFPAKNNTLYGRMFVWVDALPGELDGARFLLASATGSNDKTEVRLDGVYRMESGKTFLGIGSDGGETGDWHIDGKEPGSVARAQEWMCLEWLWKGDSNETRVWVDGTEQVSLHTKDYTRMGASWVHPTYDKLRIGWWVYQALAMPNPIDVWIDEVIIDDERVGCVL